MAKVNRVIKEVQRLLKKDARGLTIEEISKRTKVSRITAAMALMKLDGMGVLYVRPIGNCKLHYLREMIENG